MSKTKRINLNFEDCRYLLSSVINYSIATCEKSLGECPEMASSFYGRFYSAPVIHHMSKLNKKLMREILDDLYLINDFIGQKAHRYLYLNKPLAVILSISANTFYKYMHKNLDRMDIRVLSRIINITGSIDENI